MTSIRSQVAGPDLEVAQRIWRTVRRLGAGRLTPGAAILPFRDDLKEQLDWLAQEVEEHDGDARVLPVVDLGEGGARVYERMRADRRPSTSSSDRSPATSPSGGPQHPGPDDDYSRVCGPKRSSSRYSDASARSGPGTTCGLMDDGSRAGPSSH